MEWVTSLFRSLRISIFIYYFLTSTAFLGILYYFLAVAEVKNTLLLGIVVLCFVTLGGVLISKLSIDPLEEHVKNLQELSKETLHELNLPIATINTNLHMLKKSANERDLKRIERIEKASMMLQERYDELDYMIKTQTQRVIKERLDVAELVQERLEFLAPLYANTRFETNLSACEIECDRIGLAKVIDNLIDNGVKYSPQSAAIAISLDKNSLSIQDFGKGMDEVELIRIFDAYYQADSSTKGFGIGLSMVKRFCDEQNIELGLKSAPNIGTTIKLTFKELHR